MFDIYGFVVPQRRRPVRQPEVSSQAKLVRGVRADGEPIASLWEWAKIDYSKRRIGHTISASDAVAIMIRDMGGPLPWEVGMGIKEEMEAAGIDPEDCPF